jgi:hypothetical protein
MRSRHYRKRVARSGLVAKVIVKLSAPGALKIAQGW